MKLIGNILWIVFGGFILALMWAVAGLLLCITVIGIPFGVQCFKFAAFVFWPFGKKIETSGKVVSFLFNVIWLILLGWELALTSVAFGLLWCATVVGIPFGLQWFKFARLALMPFGSKIV